MPKPKQRDTTDFLKQLADAKASVKGPLPPADPDYFDCKNSDINADRAGWARAAVITFFEQTGSDLEDAVADLIGDLGHFCDRHGMNMAEQIERGREFYEYETQEEGKAFDSI